MPLLRYVAHSWHVKSSNWGSMELVIIVCIRVRHNCFLFVSVIHNVDLACSFLKTVLHVQMHTARLPAVQWLLQGIAKTLHVSQSILLCPDIPKANLYPQKTLTSFINSLHVMWIDHACLSSVTSNECDSQILQADEPKTRPQPWKPIVT